MDTLYPTAPVKPLPLVKGEDVDVTITYKPLLVDEAGEPILDEAGKKQYIETDWPEGYELTLIVERSSRDGDQAEGVATITGSKARMRIDHLEVDKAKPDQLWRIVRTDTLDDDLDKVILQGKTKRYDGVANR